MRKIIDSPSHALRVRYGIMIGGALAECQRMLHSPAFWDGFRDGFTAWMRVFDIPPRPPKPGRKP
ncbi:hypothetical protein [Roseovarius indicus]|uniref:hypothetical protein n=1 Tax=Roseovarius indicus TaxID=540747 RepID=UPI004059E360